MKRASIAVMAAFGLFLVGCSAGVHDFSPSGGGFKVAVPGTPQEKTQKIAGADTKTYQVETRDGAYAVSYTDLKGVGKESQQQQKARLDGARDGAVKNINGKLRSEKEIKLDDKYPGREIVIDLAGKNGVVRQRFYLVKDRFYQILVAGTPAFVDSTAATAFLDSFALTH